MFQLSDVAKTEEEEIVYKNQNIFLIKHEDLMKTEYYDLYGNLEQVTEL